LGNRAGIARLRRAGEFNAFLADFLAPMADWHFDWLDVPRFLRSAEVILEYPMVDKDPLPRWSFGRITLLGDAAHPMYPRGSNGAGQAILDARALAESLAAAPGDPAGALQEYERRRLPTTARVVRANRTTPPDAILGEVFRRTGDKAVRVDRGCDPPRRAHGYQRRLQARCRLRPRCARRPAKLTGRCCRGRTRPHFNRRVARYGDLAH